MIDRSNPDMALGLDAIARAGMNPDTVIGGGCDDDGMAFIQQALAMAGSCGVQPAAQAAGCGVVGPRLTTIGSPVTTILSSANTDVTITIRTGTFIGRRLILPNATASLLRVASVKVGNTNILSSADPINGSLFSSANMRGGDLPFIPAPTNQTITVSLLSIDTQSVSGHPGLEGVTL